MARKPGKHRKAKRTASLAPKIKPRSAAVETLPSIEPALDDEPVIEVEEFHPIEGGETADAAPDVSAAEPIEPIEPIETDGDHPAAEGDSESDGSTASSASERGALVTVDPLGRYLAEIRRFPLLSREDETVVAKRYAKTHDAADAYRLVTANLRLVVKISLEFARASRNVLDLIQEGNVGLMEAVKNFDPYRGIRFPSYAVWWVRAYIYRYLINNWRLVKIGTTQAQRKLFFNLRKESDRLEAEGFTAQPKLLAQRIGVKESEVREMQERMAQSEVSLDQPTAGSEDTRLLDVIPDGARNPEEETAEREWRTFARDRVEEFAATLRDKELEIFRSRLLAEEPETLREIGERFGISRERVRQIETRLKRRLKEFVRVKAGGVDVPGAS
ncbi:MAG TPA: RNA polymerase factor sigma-32 [Candidatus Binataceae bacterium]